ncbi:unnamed protein product [Gongylonema pulchrum]|uniref:Transmembrane protein n=1 Tax=Gongylonema pulchrum TaxID=637853 RepID=A0A183EJP7_9BILA|nr:unnamed protein product [Gongylonema pulchrum]
MISRKIRKKKPLKWSSITGLIDCRLLLDSSMSQQFGAVTGALAVYLFHDKQSTCFIAFGVNWVKNERGVREKEKCSEARERLRRGEVARRNYIQSF